MIPPSPKRSPWGRRYAWVVYAAAACFIVGLIGVGLWIDGQLSESPNEDTFVAICAESSALVSRRHCSCVWDELRNHYTEWEIMANVQSLHWGDQFNRRFMEAVFDDCP